MGSDQAARGEITTLLGEWGRDGSRMPERLLDLTYPQLHRIACNLFRGEREDSLLQPTSVVNELFFRLVRQHDLQFDDRQHFYRLAARLMRNILIDQARTEMRQKRDGRLRVPLSDDVLSGRGTAVPDAVDAIDLDRALQELERHDPEKLRMVEFRFFLGCTLEETAGLLEVSKAKVDRDLRFVRGWLKVRLQSV